MPAVFDSPHALLQVVAQPLGSSPWHEVTQAEINAFAAATGDRQWIHTDPVRAAAEGQQQTIAHGLLVLSWGPAWMDQIIEIAGVQLVLNYGLNRVRFPHAVHCGARLRLNLELAECQAEANWVQAAWRLTFEIEGVAKPACVAELLLRYLLPNPSTPRS